MTAPFTLHAALTRAAEHWGDRRAVSDSNVVWSYATLVEAAGRVAAALQDLGVHPGDRVAVLADKAPATIAALYGIMGIGAVCVPIDPLAPPLRVGSIFADAECSVVCAGGPRSGRILAAAHRPDARVLALTDDIQRASVTRAELDRCSSAPLNHGCEEDLAYLFYTSGSTGTPKGVMLTHRNMLAFVEWAVDRFGINSADRLSSHAPFHFDLSVLDLYGASLAGAAVHILSAGEAALGASMAGVIRDQQLTVWYSVPSALVSLCETTCTDNLGSLRVLLFAGEVFPTKYLPRLRALAPRALLANLYGPTETGVCTYYLVPDLLPTDAPIPIGRACENQEVFVLGDDRRLVRDGEAGELYVRGPTVMKGYWRNPHMTESSLMQNPLHERFPDDTYRTGDLVRRLPGGGLEFLGRRDHQVKSRGYRIELGEIEAALVSHDTVREAAVVPIPDERIGHALIAYVAGHGVPEESALKRHCAQRISRYMIPGRITTLDALPHTSTGKIDRQALRERLEHN